MRKLIEIASAPLVDGPPAPGLPLALKTMLEARNGFFAFESALHVFPSQGLDSIGSLEWWNRDDLWRHAYGDIAEGLTFFAEDVFGGQFCLTGAGQVAAFDPETGELDAMARDLDGWVAEVLGDYQVRTGHPLAHEWQARYGPLPAGKRLVPKLPFVVGGEFAVDNLALVDAVAGMRARGNLAIQIRDLPDGSSIKFDIVE